MEGFLVKWMDEGGGRGEEVEEGRIDVGRGSFCDGGGRGRGRREMVDYRRRGGDGI